MAWSAGQRYLAEFLGTFALLVFGGGSAIFSAQFGLFDPNARAILVATCFGVTVLGMAYLFGEISGGHFNPAVTLSMALSRRMAMMDVVPYVVMQLLGGIIGMFVIAGIAHGSSIGWTTATEGSFGSQCYASSLNGCTYSIGSVFLLEMVITFLFVLVIQRITRPDNGAKNLAPIGIGLTLLVANLVAIPVDGASLNPVRSFAPALLSQIWAPSGGAWALGQSWLFWIAPILGGLLAAVVEMFLRSEG